MSAYKLDELFEIEGMGERVKREIESFDKKDLLVEDSDDTYDIMIHTISSGAMGLVAARNIVDFFGLGSDDIMEDDVIEDGLVESEGIWEMIEEHAEKIAKELNEKIVVPGFRGTFYFGNLAMTEDWGLFFTWSE